MNKHEEIIAEAFKLFSEKGEHFSMVELGKSTGLNKSSLYHYFSSKEELIYEMIGIEIASYFNLRNEEIRSIKGNSIEEKLRENLFATLKYFRQDNKLRFWKRILLMERNDLYARIGTKMQEHEIEYISILKTFIAEGVSNGSIDPLNSELILRHYVAIGQGLLTGMQVNDDPKFIDQYAEDVWQSFWYGISKK